MSVIDTIKVIKKIETKRIVMVRIGKFMYTYGKDACIVSYIMKYKVKKIDGEIYVCTFPRHKISVVVEMLKKQKIQYLIVDKRNSYRVDEESNKEELNQYDNILPVAVTYVKRKQKIDNIYLLLNIEKDEIDEIIILLKKDFHERRKI